MNATDHTNQNWYATRSQIHVEHVNGIRQKFLDTRNMAHQKSQPLVMRDTWPYQGKTSFVGEC